MIRTALYILFALVALEWSLPGMAAIIEVKAGESIQSAVTAATAGDIIHVSPGTYKETVYIDKDDITLRGIVSGGNWPHMDGEGFRNDAILYSGSGITVENFKITRYKGNGIMGQAGNNFVIRNNWIIDAGLYGIFPEFGKNGLVEHNVLSGISDAAIYIGMSDNVDVRHNEVFDSVAGIEIENSRHCLVENNYVHNNTAGIMTFITPGLPIKTSYDVVIRNNFIIENNHENFAIPGSIVSFTDSGTGIIVMASDDVVIENNIITGHKNVGIAVASLDFIANIRSDPDSEPHPDRLQILDNLMWENGADPAPQTRKVLEAYGLPMKGPDVIDVSSGKDRCALNASRYTTVGMDAYGPCKPFTTASLLTKRLEEPVPPREIAAADKGKAAFFGICAGCHAYSVKMIGPPTMTIQAVYNGRPNDLATYIANPHKVREDYPEMPPQNYLAEDVRQEVAKYMLSIDR